MRGFNFCINSWDGSIPVSFKRWWYIRLFFDVTINVGARNLVMFTFPILLGSEAPLDFVKDCLAVFFITTLDDLDSDDYKSIEQMMIIVKYRLYMDASIKSDQNAEVSQDDDYQQMGTKTEQVLKKEEVDWVNSNKAKLEALFNFQYRKKDMGKQIWKKMLQDAKTDEAVEAIKGILQHFGIDEG